MARNRASGYDPRKVWSTNLAPLVTAAREGASHAAETASKQRAQARRDSRWWRQRWLLVTASGLVVAGATGGVYRALAKRRTAEAESGTGAAAPGQQPDRSTPVETIRSTVESGREKVTEATRNVLHKIRREEPERPEAPAEESLAPESPSPNSATPGRPAPDRSEPSGFVTKP